VLVPVFSCAVNETAVAPDAPLFRLMPSHEGKLPRTSHVAFEVTVA